MSNELKPKRAPSVLCPHCNGLIDPDGIDGTWLERRCPECGGLLTAHAYDSLARKLLDLRALQRAEARREKGKAARHAKAAARIGHPLFGPLRYVLRKYSDWHAERSAKALKRVAETHNDLVRLAAGCYYTSEWYLCSGCMLEGVDASHGSYALDAKYDDKGRLRLVCKEGGVVVGGILGERTVFETLFACTSPGSALEGARIVPNAFLPSADAGADGLADQTDLIVLTREAAFVLEVKNWRSHIKVAKADGEIKIGSYQDARYARPDMRDSQKSVTQIMRRVQDVMALGLYPHDRVFGAVVFVDPLSIDISQGGTDGDVFVAACFSNGLGTLLAAIEERISRLGDAKGLLSREEVDSMAQRMLSIWVDRTGELQRGQMKIRDAMHAKKQQTRQARLVALADFSVERRQAGYQKRAEHGKKREEAKSRARKSRGARSQRHARMQRIYEIEREYDEWDYRAC